MPPYSSMNIFRIIIAVVFFVAAALPSSAAQKSADRPSYLVFEANTGRILFSDNAEASRGISCLGQVATAMVAIDWINARSVSLDQLITVPSAVQTFPQQTNPLRLTPGDRLTLRDAIFSTVFSADSASAYAVAYHVGSDLYRRGGGKDPVALFVENMNILARDLGMVKTRFVAPYGQPYNGRLSASCAVDLALLGMYAMQNNAFSFIASQKVRNVVIHRMGGEEGRQIINTNKMLGWTGGDGIKSARSKAAGECLMFSVTRNSVTRVNPATGLESRYPQRVIGVILGMQGSSDEKYKFAAELVRAAWPAWEKWLKSNDRTDGRDFLFFKKKLILP